jgi:hypothetical protein
MRELLDLVGSAPLPISGLLALSGIAVLFLRLVISSSSVNAIPRLIAGTISTIGFILTMSTPSGAGPRQTDHPLRPESAPGSPWLPAEGPPPLPSAGSRGPWLERSAHERLPSVTEGPVHPAIHGGGGKPAAPLFPRLKKADSDPCEETARRECMLRHPAGKGLKGFGPTPQQAEEDAKELVARNDGLNRRTRPGRYVVQRGDSLWGIAEEILGTESPAKVARFWPQIHRMNRDVIGRDPNLLVPGQVLALPDPTDR